MFLVMIKKIKDLEKYLVDLKNVFFEINVKNRLYELVRIVIYKIFKFEFV